MIGSSLGPYKILEQLGAGGMGEVYLAEDTRLNRKVAVKVLPAEFAVDRERLARFEQEAKAAAALNHPHIAAVFDVGSEVMRRDDDAGDAGADGGSAAGAAVATHFMVQEYLDGHTLRTVLNKGALPVGKALLYAREIAEALGAAHEAGIVHRDLKPDNVFITKDGHAKVLDFGLAKLTELHGPEGKELSMSPTVLGTVAGQVMGTAGYMSPEQIDSDVAIDGRADLFAFGCLLYEMSGGKRAFGGDSILDTLHAIARTDPQPVGELNPELPADLERIVKKCLAKDRENRYQHAKDVLVDIKTLASEVEAGTVRTVAERNAGIGEGVAVTAGIPWKFAAPAALAIALVAAAGAWMLRPSAVPADERIIRFDLALPADVAFTAVAWPTIALSPDGDTVAVTANQQVFLRAMGDHEFTPLRGSEGIALVPFFSPDGEYVGFWAEGEMRKVSIGGGAAVKLADQADPPFGASWSADNTVLFARDGIWRVSADGGEPEELIPAPEGSQQHGPQALPDGSILYTLFKAADIAWDDSDIVVQRPGDPEPTVLVAGGRDARWLPTGHIVYALEDAIIARTFDLESRAVGGAVPLVQGVLGGFGVSGASHFATAATGDLVYLPGEANDLEPVSLVWRGADGAKEFAATASEAGRTWTPRLSPDGRYVAYRTDGSDGSNIWMLDLQRGIHQLFTPGGGARSFAWSPDGLWLYYSADSGTDAGTDVYRRRADMSADAEEILGGPGNELVRAVSPDGEYLLYADATVLSTGAYDIAVIAINEGEPGEPQPVFDRDINETTATFAPNGKWVAYVAGDEESRVFVQGFPNLGGMTQVSDGLGTEPLWAPDSKRLFYRRERDIMVVDVTSDEPFDVSAPRVFLSDVLSLSDTQNAGSYDISRDGERLLMVDWDNSDTAGVGAIEVVLNWVKDLRERVPVAR